MARWTAPLSSILSPARFDGSEWWRGMPDAERHPPGAFAREGPFERHGTVESNGDPGALLIGMVG